MDGAKHSQGQAAVVQHVPMKRWSAGRSFYKATVTPSVTERFKVWPSAGSRGVWYAERDVAGCTGGCPGGVLSVGRSVMVLMGDQWPYKQLWGPDRMPHGT